MLEKPDLADPQIIDCLRRAYTLDVASLDFLPLGNDSNAWVYRVETTGESVWFLKVRRGEMNAPALMVPRFLRDSGLEQIVAPLPTRTQALWQSTAGYALILYPYIDGRTGMDLGLSNDQWVEFGNVLQRIHTSQLPPDLLATLRRETFVPTWSESVRALEARIAVGGFATVVEAAFAAFWMSQQAEIRWITDRTEALGRKLQARSADFVLCHADIHTANLLIDTRGQMHIVDWDEVLLAPIERDLMFVLGSDQVLSDEAEHFLSGYGTITVDPLALAYYHYEWVVQEIGDFGERIFSRDDLGDEIREDALRGFQQLFDPGDVVEAAYRSEDALPPDQGS